MADINSLIVYGLILTLTLSRVTAMIAYDCASKEMNITSISLLDTEPCPPYRTESIVDNIEVQVLQERETYNVHIYQCLIEIDYHVTYCGMHSHSSEVKNGWGTMIQDLTEDECKQMHRSNVAYVFGKTIQGVHRNSTLTTTINLAGTVNSEGKCTGGDLNLGANHWSSVVGVAKVSIKLSDSTGIYRIADDTVVSRTGLSCKYSARSCMDAYDGLITWDIRKDEKCTRSSYLVLYRGRVSKVTIKATGNKYDSYVMYSVKDGKFLATLLEKGTKVICGITVTITDHPKLLIQEIKSGLYFFEPSGLASSNMDIFLYVNAKFTHIENHMRREMSTMYETIIKDQCETKRALLQTQLTLATIDPVEFAYTYKQEPGYSSVVMGEQVHLVKCKAVYVTARKIEGCYNEMPVNYTGKPMFMAPRSRIIQKTGTPITCSVLMQPTYRIAGVWYVSQSGLTKTSEPSLLSPVSETKWTYTDAGELATQGIYSYNDLDVLRAQLMYPSERKAISQTMSAAINQDSYISDTSMFNKLLTKDAVEASFKGFMNDTWVKFMTFGNFFSGVFGVLLLTKLIKWSFDTIVHSKGLYEVYGCGWHLIASVWDAATTYFLSPVRVAKAQTKIQEKTEEKLKQAHEIESPPQLYPVLETPSAPTLSTYREIDELQSDQPKEVSEKLLKLLRKT